MMLVCLLIVLLIIILIFFVKTHTVWKKRGIPQLSPCEIFRDSLFYFIGWESVPSLIKKVYRKFQDERYFGIYQFGTPALVIRDPELINDLSIKHFNHFTDHLNFVNDKDDIFWQTALLVLKGERWKKMRSVLNQMYTPSKIRSMFPIVDRTSQKYVDYYLDHPKEMVNIEVYDSIGRLNINFIAACTYGHEIDSLENRSDEFYTNLKKTAYFVTTFDILIGMLNSIIPNLYKYIDLKRMSPSVYEFFKQLTLNQIKERKKNNIRRPDVINLLMDARDQYEEEVNKEEGKNYKGIELTDDNIAVQVIGFNLGAYNPVSTVLCFSLYHLALAPDIQKRLQMEIDQVLATNEQLSLEKVMSMKYLDMVVSETYRMYPMVFYSDRVCTKAFTIEPKRENEAPVELAEGDLILFSHFGLHRDPRYFPDPDRFDPERFSDENKRNIDNYACIPFGVGPRHCIGYRLALMQTKTILFRILCKLEVVVTDKTVIPLRFGKRFAILSSSGTYLGYKKRNLKN